MAGLPGASNNLSPNAPYVDSTAVVPQIRAQKGVVHAASQEAGITSGSRFSIAGWKLAGETRGVDGDELPTRLEGVEVKINGQLAPLYSVSPTKIEAQVPRLDVEGTATLEVIRDGVASEPEPVEIRRASPELFRYSLGSKSFVAAYHDDGSIVADPALARGHEAARVGETLRLLGTGIDASLSDALAMTHAVVGVDIGGKAATATFVGKAGPGVFQVNIVVPAGLASGNHPVTLRVGSHRALVPGLLAVQ